MTNYKIVRQYEVIEADETGRFVEQVKVEFMVDRDGPFSIIIPKEIYSKAEREKKIMEYVRELER